MSNESNYTTDHDEIRRWAEARGGKPASVKGTGKGDEPGVLRIDFPDYGAEDEFEPISWDAFFRKFDEEELAFVYQDKTGEGETSRFSKLVSRESAAERAGR